MEILGVALELARADAHEGEAVAVRLVHVGLNFKDEGGKIGGVDVYLAGVAHARQRRRGHLKESVQKRLNAEVGERAAEEHGGELAVAHGVEVKVAARAEQLHLVSERVTAGLTDQVDERGVVQLDGGDAGLFRVALVGEVENAALAAVVHAEKFLAAADRPVDGIGVDAQLALDLLAQLERVACFAVHLIDKGKDGDIAQGADLEELARLRLDALRAVDDHHGAVRGHQRAVGVLREVLMSRRIENVDAVAAVLELHDRRRDRNAALLFDFHPVGFCRALALALDFARLRDGSAVEQELFRQRGFTGVRVRNDRKRPAAGDLFL